MTKTYNEANLETAMCLWEAVLDMRAALDHATLDDPRLPTLKALDSEFEKYGTSAMRNHVASWVEECEAAWEADQAAGTELVPYDWEHCPAFVMRKLKEMV